MKRFKICDESDVGDEKTHVSAVILKPHKQIKKGHPTYFGYPFSS